MKLIYIHRADFDKRPPVISAIYILLSLNIKPILITTGISEYYKNDLTKKGVVVHVLPFSMASKKIQKIIDNLRFRKAVYRILKNYNPRNYTLWIEGNYTFVALGKRIKKYRLILQIQELYKNMLERNATATLIKDSILNFMPEYNRAVHYQIDFNLKSKPLVLPNKPYFSPADTILNSLKTKHKDIIDSIKNKKVILYQGLLSIERDLSPFIEATKKMSSDYKVVLLGKDYGVMNGYLKINPNIIHIDYLPAPDYLYFTRLAYIGIVTYNPYALNSAYCAPNKIFEYAAYGKPMIGNDIPGLKYSVEKHKMGIIIDDKNYGEILQAIDTIESNYDEYSKNALSFFNSVDNQETIRLALNQLEIT